MTMAHYNDKFVTTQLPETKDVVTNFYCTTTIFPFMSRHSRGVLSTRQATQRSHDCFEVIRRFAELNIITLHGIRNYLLTSYVCIVCMIYP